ncbi:hypothetical protein CDAR_531541 [Caerostris darwini]|uniref:Uncharacterized protein n=1 Tax=Caerostris darwini TaxID=1538125 RepID=A0AAV4QVX6_9ARAC|nr:hypothetical protein CDAR_531541 [Caerostris darwini]
MKRNKKWRLQRYRFWRSLSLAKCIDVSSIFNETIEAGLLPVVLPLNGGNPRQIGECLLEVFSRLIGGEGSSARNYLPGRFVAVLMIQ